MPKFICPRFAVLSFYGDGKWRELPFLFDLPYIFQPNLFIFILNMDYPLLKRLFENKTTHKKRRPISLKDDLSKKN